MQQLHAAPPSLSFFQNALFFALFGQRMHTPPLVCIAYAGYASPVYDNEITSVMQAHVSTLSTWLSTVFHGRSLDFWPFRFKPCGKPCPESGFSTCGDCLTFVLPGYYKACQPVLQAVTIFLEKRRKCRENVDVYRLRIQLCGRYDDDMARFGCGHCICELPPQEPSGICGKQKDRPSALHLAGLVQV